MQERMAAVLAVVQLSEQERTPKVKKSVATENKLKKALDKLEKLLDLSSINEKYNGSTEIESVRRVISFQCKHTYLCVVCMI